LSVVGVIFTIVFLAFKDSAIPIHWGIMTVFAIAFTEALSWYVAYALLNETGTPYCCPFSYEVILALAMQVLRQTVSRTLLLLVTLGLGIVRQSLTVTESMLVTLVTLMYLAAAVVAAIVARAAVVAAIVVAIVAAAVVAFVIVVGNRSLLGRWPQTIKSYAS
jgi:hypothetical protein